MQFVNLTPHVIRVYRLSDFTLSVFVPDGRVARVATTRDPSEERRADVFFVVGPARPGAVVGLPEPVEGVAYLVSGMVRDALGASRPDVFAPATGPDDEVERRDGQVFAVTRLVGVPTRGRAADFGSDR